MRALARLKNTDEAAAFDRSMRNARCLPGDVKQRAIADAAFALTLAGEPDALIKAALDDIGDGLDYALAQASQKAAVAARGEFCN